MTKYMLLIYGEEHWRAGMTAEQQQAMMTEWGTYTEQLAATGKMLGGDALEPTGSATTVRGGQGGAIVTSDGPFAETKEQLGGYYAIETDSVEDAADWASKMPHVALGGAVEVRPIMEFDN